MLVAIAVFTALFHLGSLEALPELIYGVVIVLHDLGVRARQTSKRRKLMIYREVGDA